jgi:hypothetical protein
MDELIGDLAADVSIDRNAAEKAVGFILDFLAKEGPADKAKLILAKLSGAEALMQKAAAEGGGVMGAGPSTGQVQDVTRQFIVYARGKVGEDALSEIVGAIPGLSQFV